MNEKQLLNTFRILKKLKNILTFSIIFNYQNMIYFVTIFNR